MQGNASKEIPTASKEMGHLTPILARNSLLLAVAMARATYSSPDPSSNRVGLPAPYLALDEVLSREPGRIYPDF